MMKRWKPVGMAVALCAGMLLVLSSCDQNRIPVKNEQPYIEEGDSVWGGVDGVVNLAQGWSRDVQQWWWFTSQGTQIIPYDWFMHLEQAGNTEPLRSNDNMRRLGYLVQRPTSLNPDGLPVGFVEDKNPNNGNWFGVNCSACHTSQIEYNGQAIRIDGGPALGNFNRLVFGEILGSMEATLNDTAKLDRFATSVLGNNAPPDSLPALRARLESRTAFLRQRAVANAAPDSLAGHGRLDAVNNIFNAVFGQDLGIENSPNVEPADAPVSYPAIWDAPQTDLVQWAGFVDNSAPGGPLSRNLGEVLGVFATFRFDEESRGSGYESSVLLTNQGWLEEWLTSLWSPRWPERYLGAIDAEDSTAGRVTYLTYCISCHHLLKDPTSDDREIRAQMWPVHYLGTDSANAADFANRASGLVETGKIEGRPKIYVEGAPLPDSVAGIDVLTHGAAGIAARQPGQAVGSFLRSAFTHVPDAPPFDPVSYRARPLNGIWATAPFLHNGSVPNLWELLKADSLRVTTFYVGSREYDPANVGYVMSMPTDGVATLVDTSLPGSANTGHNFGVEMSETAKRQLIEYIKSL